MSLTFVQFALSTGVFFLAFTEAALLPRRSSSSFSTALQTRDVAGFTYVSCYTEARDQRALTGGSYYDDLMTVEKCATACSSFTTFGVEYGRECFCGNRLNAGSVVASEADCSFNCPGNAEQKCGAGNRLNIYTKSAATSPVPTTYAAQGCFSEPDNAKNGRALSDKTTATNDMTVDKCSKICVGFTYFGLEYYSECFCGNTLRTGSLELDSSKCKFPCSGNANELCGGDWALNLYTFGDGAAPTPTPPTPAPSTSYVSDGCYTEATSQRALSGSAYYDDRMTIAKCEAVCSGYSIYGVEYGRECFCGNFLNQGSVKTDNSECSFPCSGDSTQKCGAGNRLNLYRKPVTQPSSFSSSPSPSSTVVSSSSTTMTTTSESSSEVLSTTSSSAESSTTSSETSSSSSTTSSSEIPTSTTSSAESSSTESSSSIASSSATSELPASTTSSTESSSTSAVASSTESSSSSSEVSSSMSTTSSITPSSTSSSFSDTPSSSSTSESPSSSPSTTTSESPPSTTTTTTTTTTSPVSCPTQLVGNPSFETPDDVWTVLTTGPAGGLYSLGFARSGTRAFIARTGSSTATVSVSQTLTVTPGVSYKLSLWSRRQQQSNGCVAALVVAGVTVGNTASTGNINVYALTEANFVPTTGSVQLLLRTQCAGVVGTRDLFLDDVTVAPLVAGVC